MWNMFHVHSLKPNVPMVYIFSEQRKKEKLSIYVKLFRLYLWRTICWNSPFGVFVFWRFIQVSSEIMEWHGQTGKHSLFLSIYLSLSYSSIHLSVGSHSVIHCNLSYQNLSRIKIIWNSNKCFSLSFISTIWTRILPLGIGSNSSVSLSIMKCSQQIHWNLFTLHWQRNTHTVSVKRAFVSVR